MLVSSYSFKDFVNIEIFKENSDSIALKPARNYISASLLNHNSTLISYTKNEVHTTQKSYSYRIFHNFIVTNKLEHCRRQNIFQTKQFNK